MFWSSYNDWIIKFVGSFFDPIQDYKNPLMTACV